ncbi:transposase, partial [Natronococcus pandeyae]
ESVPLDKAERDDSPRDGSGCDTATTSFETAKPSRDHERRSASFERHRETSVPAQMTLTAYEESEPSASDD